MSKSFHMCQGITGPLKNWTKRDWNHHAKAWNRKDGSIPTGEELKDYFLEMLGKGHEVLPMDGCDNFDKKKGCKGHTK
jgi:hypothetical protein